PPGSITGAPKVRAMQIINELEGRARGPYCGSLGWIDGTSGDATFNVAIRTAHVRLEPGSTPCDGRGIVTYPVGAGIVAESDPGLEWQETLHKAETFLAAIESHFDEEASR
ncbi:MAG: chorismate-binding protein, partial [Phycisphaerales bacterium]|nr:chorismate-binding protein [Phycisphaerales bacterium]